MCFQKDIIASENYIKFRNKIKYCFYDMALEQCMATGLLSQNVYVTKNLKICNYTFILLSGDSEKTLIIVSVTFSLSSLNKQLHVCMCMYICNYICLYMYVYICIYVHVYITCLCVCVWVFIHICLLYMYVQMHVCVQVCIYVNIHMAYSKTYRQLNLK